MRLMLAGFLLGIVHDRRLMRESQVNLAIRWFVGYAVHEALPDHSSLTRIRQRWGEDVFHRIFTRVVRQCQQAGMVSAGAVHIDASLIRANVSMDALVTRHLDAVEAAADHTGRDARASGRFKKLCRTDPDASCQRMRHRFKHRWRRRHPPRPRCARPTSSTRPLMTWQASSSMWRS
ncbi:transposase [Sinirhodobacter populi]|uniref:Transposase n=1 Tax=Paenirhodobacter populi TaxID=2306993 RepID=A0A443JVU4_9RHOB|nr:transposase [Sinirhodobacter populi]